MFVVSSCFSSLTLIMEVNSLVLALNCAIRVVLALNGDNAVALLDGVTDVVSFFKSQTPRLVIIEDSNSAFSVASN